MEIIHDPDTGSKEDREKLMARFLGASCCCYHPEYQNLDLTGEDEGVDMRDQPDRVGSEGAD